MVSLRTGFQISAPGHILTNGERVGERTAGGHFSELFRGRRTAGGAPRPLSAQHSGGQAIHQFRKLIRSPPAMKEPVAVRHDGKTAAADPTSWPTLAPASDVHPDVQGELENLERFCASLQDRISGSDDRRMPRRVAPRSSVGQNAMMSRGGKNYAPVKRAGFRLKNGSVGPSISPVRPVRRGAAASVRLMSDVEWGLKKASEIHSQLAPEAAAARHRLSVVQRQLIAQALEIHYPGLGANQGLDFHVAHLGQLIDQYDPARASDEAKRLHDLLVRMQAGNGDTNVVCLPIDAEIGRQLVEIRDTMTSRQRHGSPAGYTAQVSNALSGVIAVIAIQASQQRILDRLQALVDPSREGTPPGASSGILQAAKNPFPVGAALRACAIGFPHLEGCSLSPEAGKRQMAAEGLACLLDLMSTGEAPAALLGLDKSLDSTLLGLSRERAQRLALAHAESQKPQDPLTEAERQRVLDGARTAAQARHDLTMANLLLERQVKVNRHVRYWPAAGGRRKTGFGPGMTSALRKDANFAKALVKLCGKRSLPRVALLLARIANLEAETIKLEHAYIGLHRKPGSIASIAVRSGEPLAFLGVSGKQLRAMGLDARDVVQLNAEVERLSKQGLTSFEDVVAANQAIQSVLSGLFRTSLASRTVEHLQQATPQAQAAILLTDFLHEVQAPSVATGPTPLPHERLSAVFHAMERLDAVKHDALTGGTAVEGARPAGLSPEEIKAYKAIGAKLNERCASVGVRPADRSADDRLCQSADLHRRHEQSIIRLLREQQTLESEIEKRRAALAAGAKAFGIDQRRAKPRGLRAARVVLALIDSFESGSFGQHEVRKLRKLRGMTASRRQRTWHDLLSQALVPDADAATRESVRRIRDFAGSIVWLRDAAPAERRRITREISENTESLDGLLVARRAAGSDVVALATRLTRIAVLAHWPIGARDYEYGVANGTVSETYDPSLHRAAIEETLSRWGLDTERFSPEIDAVLYGSVTGADLQAWRRDAGLIDTRLSRRSTALSAPGGGPPVLTMPNSSLRHAFLSLLENLQDGDKLDVIGGHRVTADSLRVPLEPSATAYARAKLAGSRLGQFEIECGSDGISLNLRAGRDGGADIAAGGRDVTSIIFDVNGRAGGSASSASGISFTFGKDDAGRRDLVRFVDDILEGKPISPRDWSRAGDVAATVQGRKKIEAALNLGLLVLPGDVKQIAGGAAGVTGRLGYQTKSTVTENAHGRTLKGEDTRYASLTASLRVYAQMFNAGKTAIDLATKSAGLDDRPGAHSGAGHHTTPVSATQSKTWEKAMSQDVAGAQFTAEASYTRKWKHRIDSRDRYLKAEIVRQKNFKGHKLSELAAVSAPCLMRILEERSDESDLRKAVRQAFRNDLTGLLEMARTNDSIAVTYGLKAQAIAMINHLLDDADLEAVQGRPERAKKLKWEARKSLDDMENYEPQKISLMATHVDKQKINYVNAGFLRLSKYSEGKFEHPKIILDVPLHKLGEL